MAEECCCGPVNAWHKIERDAEGRREGERAIMADALWYYGTQFVREDLVAHLLRRKICAQLTQQNEIPAHEAVVVERPLEGGRTWIGAAAGLDLPEHHAVAEDVHFLVVGLVPAQR